MENLLQNIASGLDINRSLKFFPVIARLSAVTVYFLLDILGHNNYTAFVGYEK